MPTASAVRRIAETLCGLLTPSASTVRSGWRRASARRSLANRSGVIGAVSYAYVPDRDRRRDTRPRDVRDHGPRRGRRAGGARGLGALPRVRGAYERVADDLRER